MNFHLKNARLSSLQWQRNTLAGVCGVLLIITTLQMVLLFFKNTKVIILPPEVRQSFWVEGNYFSPSYIEEQGLYFAHLLLDVSPLSVLNQGEILLRYVDSAFYGEFRKKLLEEEQRLKRDNVSIHFTAIECEVFPKELALEITGDLNSYVVGKKISSHRETYRLEFSSKSGRLFLKEFKAIKTDQPDLLGEHS